jgi:hypothetical protein
VQIPAVMLWSLPTTVIPTKQLTKMQEAAGRSPPANIAIWMAPDARPARRRGSGSPVAIVRQGRASRTSA